MSADESNKTQVRDIKTTTVDKYASSNNKKREMNKILSLRKASREQGLARKRMVLLPSGEQGAVDVKDTIGEGDGLFPTPTSTPTPGLSSTPSLNSGSSFNSNSDLTTLTSLSSSSSSLLSSAFSVESTLPTLSSFHSFETNSNTGVIEESKLMKLPTLNPFIIVKEKKLLNTSTSATRMDPELLAAFNAAADRILINIESSDDAASLRHRGIAEMLQMTSREDKFGVQAIYALLNHRALSMIIYLLDDVINAGIRTERSDHGRMVSSELAFMSLKIIINITTQKKPECIQKLVAVGIVSSLSAFLNTNNRDMCCGALIALGNIADQKSHSEAILDGCKFETFAQLLNSFESIESVKSIVNFVYHVIVNVDTGKRRDKYTNSPHFTTPLASLCHKILPFLAICMDRLNNHEEQIYQAVSIFKVLTFPDDTHKMILDLHFEDKFVKLCLHPSHRVRLAALILLGNLTAFFGQEGQNGLKADEKVVQTLAEDKLLACNLLPTLMQLFSHILPPDHSKQNSSNGPDGDDDEKSLAMREEKQERAEERKNVFWITSNFAATDPICVQAVLETPNMMDRIIHHLIHDHYFQVRKEALFCIDALLDGSSEQKKALIQNGIVDKLYEYVKVQSPKADEQLIVLGCIKKIFKLYNQDFTSSESRDFFETFHSKNYWNFIDDIYFADEHTDAYQVAKTLLRLKDKIFERYGDGE